MTGPVLVTGASGFVGRAVVARLAAEGLAVRAAVRRHGVPFPANVSVVADADLDRIDAWGDALSGVGVVVHCAARAHRLADDAADPLAAFRRANRDATGALARAAAAAGVARFVFVSSIGVNGPETGERPFRADDVPAPASPYAVSKREAEDELAAIAAERGLGVVVVRPPLVYGPDAPGNFATLLRAVDRGLPLPFGAIDNRRSFVAIDNLVDLIAVLVRHPQAVGQTFLVSDGEDLSTSELLRRTAAALGRPARLIPVPPALLRRGLALLGRAELAQRLCGSLVVDIGPTCARLGWRPPVGVDAALAATAQRAPRLAERQRKAVTIPPR
ncbi:MAG TPA: NAD-dependent epimerase/dehydratase family protein [Caldimonas sp.]|nr:NAD-dependent epimerase/dehydratase family protein [Caldimonas sp.]